MNIPALEAKEQIEHFALIGAIFDDKGRDYFRHLTEIAWMDEPGKILPMNEAMDAGQADKGKPRDAEH